MPQGFPEINIFGGSDPAAAQRKADAGIKSLAADGAKTAEAVNAKYFSFRDGQAINKTSESATTQIGADGAATQVNESTGLNKSSDSAPLSRLAIPGAKDGSPDRVYQAKYNDKGEITQMISPTGTKFDRVSPANDKGFAYWKASGSDGKTMKYGSNSESFVGKLSLDKDGAHIMIGHDKRNPRNDTQWAGSLVEMSATGVESRTSLVPSKDGKSTSFETQVTKKDGTTITSRSSFDKEGQLKVDADVQVQDKMKDSKYTVKNGEIIQRNENLISAERLKNVARTLDSNEKLNNLRNARITTHGDSLHVELNNKQSTHQNSTKPGTWINGTLQEGSTMSANMKFDARYQNNKIELNNIQGITGHGAKTGPFGRRLFHGDAGVAKIQVAEGQMSALTNRGWSTTPKHLMTDQAKQTVEKESIDQAGAMIKMVTENSKNVAVDKTSKRSLDFAVQPSDKAKKEMDADGLVKLENNVKGKFSYDESGFKFSNLQGVKALGQNVNEIKATPGKNGKIDYVASFTNPADGKVGKHTISEDQVRMMLKTMQKR